MEVGVTLMISYRFHAFSTRIAFTSRRQLQRRLLLLGAADDEEMLRASGFDRL